MFDLSNSSFESGSFLCNNNFNFRTNRDKQTYLAKYLHGQGNNDTPEMKLSFENLLLRVRNQNLTA